MSRIFNNEFKSMIVELLTSGRSAKELSEEYEVDSSTIRRWRRELSGQSGSFSKRSELSSEELELKALKKELYEVRMERDILKKAISIFSKSDK